MRDLQAIRGALMRAAQSANLEPEDSGDFFQSVLEWYSQVLEESRGKSPQLYRPDLRRGFPANPPAGPFDSRPAEPAAPDWITDALGGGDPGDALEGAPDGVRNDPESAAIWLERYQKAAGAAEAERADQDDQAPGSPITVVDAKNGAVSLQDVPACFHCSEKPAMYCKDCYHERYNRRTEMGTAHRAPDGFALVSTRWCTRGDRRREGYMTVDEVVTAWADGDTGATFFVLERVAAEGVGVYRMYVYARETP